MGAEQTQDAPTETPAETETPTEEQVEPAAEAAAEPTPEIEGDPVWGEIFETAPTLPWEVVFNRSVSHFQRLPDGGMLLKFSGFAQTPMGLMPVAPAVAIVFGDKGWKAFKEEVAADGERKPVIETALVMPPGVGI